MAMFRPQAYDTDPRVRKYIVPTRVIRTTGNVVGAEGMLDARPPQISLEQPEFWPACTLRNTEGSEKASILVDFGCEFNGSARIYIWGVNSKKNPGRVNLGIRFGESVTEAITPAYELGSTNDHANRDFVINVGHLSANETNESGFRFVNIELLDDDDAFVQLYMIQGVMIGRELEQLGTFTCNDERVNDIYNTAVYTAYLNMQEYLWDGIKRDRLVWCGDIYPSELTILAAYGAHDILKRSLDIHKTITPPNRWMNGMETYSLWWLMSHEELFMAGGDLDYLREQHAYMRELIHNIAKNVDEKGEEILPGGGFIDWPNTLNRIGTHAGQQGMMAMTFEKTGKMMRALGDEETAAFCDKMLALVRTVHLPHGNSKQGAALQVLGGIEDAREINENVIKPGGGHGYSTFLGYATLAAKAEADDVSGAICDMREYWGGMLDLGATTFWEDFDLNWMENAARIDELVPEGKVDVHATYGQFCYIKLRHSFCHAWASGPAPFLAKYVLGVRVLEPGCTKVAIKPDLGDLEWAEGTYPTPFGKLYVRHEKTADGIKTTFNAPDGVEVVEA